MSDDGQIRIMPLRYADGWAEQVFVTRLESQPPSEDAGPCRH